MATGRWKTGPQGSYYDPNDDGPNQVQPPPQGAQAQAAQNAVRGSQAPAAQAPAYTPGTGGITGNPTVGVDAPHNGVTQQATDNENSQAQGGLGSPQAQAVQQAVDPRRAQVQSYYQQYLGREGSEQEINSHVANPNGLNGAQVAIRGSQEAAQRTGNTAPVSTEGVSQQDQIQGYYQQFLGRAASPQEISAHMANPGGMMGAQTAIRGSAEAADRTAAQATTAAAPTAAPTTAANPNWNTDGFAGPAYTANRANGVAIPGWDNTKWQDANHQTPKYAVGRILSQFDPKNTNTAAAMQEIQKAYPGATFDGKDKLTLPGVGAFDIMKGAGNGGEAWQWNPVADAQGQAVSDAPTAGAGLPGDWRTAAPNTNQFSNQWLQDFLKQMGVTL